MGWQFSVTIPSWTQATLQVDELVVFYRVEVKVQPPDGQGNPKSRSVLRRYSHFSKLYGRLKEELGPRKMLGKELPPKRSFFGVNKHPELIEQRRKELEQWLWLLISDQDIAKSKMLNNFLELSDAARLVQRQRSRSVSGHLLSDDQSFTDAASVSEQIRPIHSLLEGDSGSEAASYTTGTATAEPSTSGIRPVQDSGVRASPRSDGTAASSSMSPGMRLGLRIQQRGSLNKQVEHLKQQLQQASSDLADSVEVIRTEQAVKQELFNQIQQLEDRLKGHDQGGGGEPEQHLDNERERNRRLAEELALERQQAAVLKAQLMQLQEHSSAEVSEAALQEKAVLQQQVEQLRQDLARSQAAIIASAGEKAAAEGKYKSDLKVLAKEVKHLRKQLTEQKEAAQSMEAHLQQQQQHQIMSSLTKELVAEVTALMRGLSECSVESMLEGNTEMPHGEEAMALIETSDNRIDCLLAQARMLSEADAGSEAVSPSGSNTDAVAAQRMFGNILSQNAQLHKHINSLLRHTIAAATKADADIAAGNPMDLMTAIQNALMPWTVQEHAGITQPEIANGHSPEVPSATVLGTL